LTPSKGNKKKNEENIKDSRNYKFQGKCNNCGLRGHLSRDLWEKEEYKNKRSESWKKRTERQKLNIVVKEKKSNTDGLLKTCIKLKVEVYGFLTKPLLFTLQYI
jgi:hypothetical protein